MNVADILENNGIIMPNPKYNPKKKKNNNEPPTITSTNIDDDIKGGALMSRGIYDAGNDSWIMNNTEQYTKYGVTPNKISNMDKERWEAQGAMAKLGNSLMQTVVSESILGMAAGVSDMFDFVGNAVFGSLDNEDYQNWLGSKIKSAQDYIKNESNPIYTDPDKNIFNGGLMSVGWWAQNAPSIASSLALFVPAKAGFEGVSKVAKTLRIPSFTRGAIARMSNNLKDGSKLKTFLNSEKSIATANLAVENASIAALSRTMENYQEARGVYQDMYGEAYKALNNMSEQEYADYIDANQETFADVDTSSRDAVAKAIAKKSADQDFKANYVNIASDIIELYALRDVVGKGNLRELSRKTGRQTDRLTRLFPLVSEEEAKAAYKKLPWRTRAKNYIGDVLIGSKMATFAQFNEGAEEVVNYLAQQEAMHTGRLLLGTEKASSWDDRYMDYLRAPQLYESAFWGVVGGIVFQAGASKLNRITNTIKNKQEDKKNYNSETGESKPESGIFALNDLPEVQRIKANINSRTDKAFELKNKLDAIYKQGTNPYNPSEKLNTQEDKDAMAALVKSQYIADMTLSAINNGTFDMTRAWFADSNVKKAFVEKGVIESDASDQWQSEVLSQMDNIKQEYEQETARINVLSASTKQSAPVEYLQIAATHNVINSVNNQALQRQMNDYLQKFQQQKAKAIEDGSLDENPFYETAMKMQMQVSYLYSLYEDRRELEKEYENNKSLSVKLAIDNINKVIKKEQNRLSGNSDFAVEDVLFSLSNVWSHNKKEGEIDADLQHIIEDSVNTGNFESLEQFLGLKEGTYGKIENEEDLKAFKKKYLDKKSSYQEAMGKINALGEGDGSMKSNYISSLYADSMIRKNNALKISTIEDFERFVGVQNNTLQEGRAKAIDSSYATLAKLFQEHKENADEFRTWLYNSINGKKNKELSFLNEVERDNLDKAMKILNLNDIRNKTLGQTIARLFDDSMIEKDENVDEDDEAISDAMDKEDSDSQSSTPHNPSPPTNQNQQPEPSEASESSESSESSETQQPTQQPAVNKNVYKFTIGEDEISIRPFNDLSESKADANELGVTRSAVLDNAIFYSSSDNAADIAPNWLQNTNLFDVDDDVDFLSTDYAVDLPVTFKFDEETGKFSVAGKGHISKVSSSPVEENVDNGQLSDQQQSQQPTTQQSETTPQQPATQPTPTPITPLTVDPETKPSSTVEAESDTSLQPSSTGELSLSEENPEDEEIIYALHQAGNASFTANNGNLDAVREKLKELAKSKTDKNADSIIDNIISGIEAREESKKNMTDEQLASLDFINSLLKKAAIPQDDSALNSRNTEKGSAKIDFIAAAIEPFVKLYSKTMLLPKINGKTVINIAQLVSTATAQMQTDQKDLARKIIENVQDFFSSEYAQENYIVEDPEHLTDSSFIDDLDKSEEELRQGKIQFRIQQNGFSIERLNINTVMQQRMQNSTMPDNNDYWDVMRNIQVGDKLRMSVANGEIVFFANKNGKDIIIGTIPKPMLGEDNSFHLVYKGWNYEVSADRKGRFEKFMENIFRGNESGDQNSKQIIEIAARYSLAKKQGDAETMSDMVNLFAKNKLIAKEALTNDKGLLKYYKQEKKDSQFKYEEALDHIANLFQYTKIQNQDTLNSQLILQKRLKELHNWFEKVFEENNRISQINNNTSAEVAYVNDGDINKLFNDPQNHFDELKPWNEAIGPHTDAHIAVVGYDGNAVIEGKEVYILPGKWNSGEVITAVYSRNAKPSFVNTKTNLIKVKDERIQRLYNAIGQYLYDYILNVNKHQMENFLKVIGSIFNFYGNKSGSLFANGRNVNYYANKLKNGKTSYALNFAGIDPKGFDPQINIYFDNDGNICSVRLVYKNTDFRNTKAYPFYNIKQNDANSAKRAAIAFRNWIGKILNTDNYWRYSIQPNAIDNFNKGIDISPIMKYENGKLKLSINDKSSPNHFEEEYDSYQDFVIKNNMVRLNTFTDEDGNNFNGIAQTQMGNKTMYVAIGENPSTDKKQTPQINAEEKKAADEKVIYENADKEKFNSLKETILTPKSENDGAVLVRQMLGNERYDELSKELDSEGINLDELFPNVISYDSRKNVVVNGTFAGSIAEAAARGDSYWTRYADDGTFRSSGRKLKRGNVVVGNLLLNMMSSKDPYMRMMAMRKLIHEQMHLTIHNEENEPRFNQLMKELRTIYKEFNSQLTNDKKEVRKLLKELENSQTKDNNRIKQAREILDGLNRLSQTLNYRNEQTKLEEFLVESLTNANFFDYLNQKHSILKKTEPKKETLLEKIAKFIAKLCGWNVKDNTLYTDVLSSINKVFNKEIKKSSKNKTSDSSRKKIETKIRNQENEEEKKKQQESKKPKIVNDIEIIDGNELKDLSNTEEGETIIQSNIQQEDDSFVLNDDADDDNYTQNSINLESPTRTSILSLNNIKHTLPQKAAIHFQRNVEDGTIKMVCSI